MRPLSFTLVALTLSAAPAVAQPPPVDNDGFIRSWLVLAPIPFPREPTGKRQVTAKQIPNEATMRPQAGQYQKIGERELVWLEHQAPKAAIDFAAFVNPARSLESLGWAVAYLVAPDAQQGVELFVGSSDQARVYLNGKEVLLRDQPRDYEADKDVVKVDLKPGVNPLVFKVVNTGGGWQGSIRLGDGSGGVPVGVRAAVHPRPDTSDIFSLDDKGYVRSWLLLAPVSYVPATVGRGELAKQPIKGEAKLAPKAGDEITVGEKKLAWKPVDARDYFVDLAEAAGGGNLHAVGGYAVTYVVSPDDKRGVKLKLGSNDQAKVYLNGSPVLTFDAPRVLRRDQDTVRVNLKKGVNVVVVKVLNTEGRWQACLRFTDEKDAPLAGLTATRNPTP